MVDIPLNKETKFAQSAEPVEYTDCNSAEGWDPTNECPGYTIK